MPFVEFTLRHLPGDADHAQSVAERLCESAGAHGDAFQVGLAVREAAVNALRHGNRLDARKRAVVTLELHGSRLVVRVRDEGDGFDPARVPDPLLPENRMKLHGRGIHLMRALMDRLVISRGERGGCELLMSKVLSLPATAALLNPGAQPP
ncbi:ATP-binding protein [Myxococcaceae bacterium GXIMD 01537]